MYLTRRDATCFLAALLSLSCARRAWAQPEPGDVIGKICGAVGLPRNFVVEEGEVPNAEALMDGSQRIIRYNPDFLLAASGDSGAAWNAFTVLAHEVGHHLCGHTLETTGSQPAREIEADHFAGFVVARLGGTLANAARPFEAAPIEPSPTHPGRQERLQAIRAGWNEGAGAAAVDSRYLVITHNQAGDKYLRVLVEFVRDDKGWMEYQHGRPYAHFAEALRDEDHLYLFDSSRVMWVRIKPGSAGRVSTGSWAPGAKDVIPSEVEWRPLDPINWR